MSKTSEHLDTAIAALAEIEIDGGSTPSSKNIHIHGSEAAQLYVASLGADESRIRTEETEEGHKFTVAQSVIKGVTVYAYGPHKVVPE